MVTGGGKDGRLVELDASLNPTGQEAHVPEHLGMLSFIKLYVVCRFRVFECQDKTCSAYVGNDSCMQNLSWAGQWILNRM